MRYKNNEASQRPTRTLSQHRSSRSWHYYTAFIPILAWSALGMYKRQITSTIDYNNFQNYLAQFQRHFASSGSSAHFRRTSKSGRHILTVPSSAHVANWLSAQSIAPTSPSCPSNSKPEGGTSTWSLRDAISNRNARPLAPPLANHRPQGLTPIFT